MMIRIHNFALPLAVWTALVLGYCRASTAQKPTFSFRIALTSSFQMEVLSAKQTLKMTGTTEIDYSLRCRKREVDISFDRVYVKATVDGMTGLDITMTGRKFENRLPGQAISVKLEDAPPAIKQMMQDSFGGVVCTYQVDAEGKELKRSVTNKPGFENFKANGQIENTRLFHSRFALKEATWRETKKISAGNGNFAKGDLQYQRMQDPDLPAHQIPVKVAGKLKLTGTQDGLEIANGEYRVSGSQVYDTKREEWIRGDLRIDAHFDLMQKEKKIAVTSGRMEVSFRERME